jgi:hypothetical protein
MNSGSLSSGLRNCVRTTWFDRLRFQDGCGGMAPVVTPAAATGIAQRVRAGERGGPISAFLRMTYAGGLFRVRQSRVVNAFGPF